MEEIKGRQERPQKKRARLLLWGPILDDIAFVPMVEDAGANVVMDDVCFGSRHCWNDVEITPDPLDGLATSYLRILCPCIYRPTKVKHKEDLKYRFGNILDYVKEYLEDAGVPASSIDYAYHMVGIMALKTRVEAFLEIIGQKA